MERTLTPREMAVAELVTNGDSNKEIADKLGISCSRVEKLIRSASDKARLPGSRGRLSAWWFKNHYEQILRLQVPASAPTVAREVKSRHRTLPRR